MMDLQSARLIVSLLQENVDTLTDGPNDEPVKDARTALSILKNDLEHHEKLLSDRQVARSIAFASIRDAEAIVAAVTQEQQAIRDRDTAAAIAEEGLSRLAPAQRKALQTDSSSLLIMPRQAFSTSDSEKDSLLHHPEMERTISRLIHREQELAIAAAPKGECTACGDQKPLIQLTAVPCTHKFCRECLSQPFELGMQHEASFPPTCCTKRIPLQTAQQVLSADLRARYVRKKLEYETPNRTYCCNKQCSAFIVAQSIEGTCDTCQECGTLTCSDCKNPQHAGVCTVTEEGRNLEEILQGNKWQRCYACRRVIELGTGCNHITCYCKAEFCYVCASQWKSCECPLWDEQRLITVDQHDPPPLVPDDLFQQPNNVLVGRRRNAEQAGFQDQALLPPCPHGFVEFRGYKRHGSHCSECESYIGKSNKRAVRCRACFKQFCGECASARDIDIS